ncbi:MAG: TniQ family protein [Betaproteobacteria bacterium]|nr:TniQ family protein [Betaproteobacteria bacterium]
MLAYFPAPYRDELLYSVLARYCRHVGSPATKQALLALFGNGRVIASFDLPGHLDALAERIPAKCGLSVDRMIDELTLYPYFSIVWLDSVPTFCIVRPSRAP